MKEQIKNHFISDASINAMKQNEIIIKALDLSDSDIEYIKGTLCAYGIHIFTTDIQWRKKLSLMYYQLNEQTWNYLMNKHNFQNVYDLYKQTRVKAFTIQLGIYNNTPKNQLKIEL